ncbi:type I secretion outer membrane protein, TolC family [Hyphomonas neptunium ATCC 15444]|uniref:Type I secretion outer membrane protein, TolC family n=2 Tax=Hyphomonas TaxID=85 RepID=Q0C1K7_HYPNA|nr:MULTISPECIES: TolC family outer membrane protein [Hyphomonas]ABI78540.1 type I secretion outer membrane protein, TolC family [Hyphomonas neptunium ATCC 15444]KCZ92530.1 TolC family type I secretion outer membrane protein [Hyphomonas hirschiana VP5]
MRKLSPRLLLGTSLLAICITSPAMAETLPEAIESAFATNPQLEIERYNTDIARQNLEVARGAGRPTVNFSATGGYEYIDTTSPFAFSVGDRPIATAQLQAIQPIYTGGKISAGIRQAQAGISSADLGFSAARQDLILQVVTAYMDVVRDREAVNIRQNNVTVTGEQVRAASDRFEVGVVTRTDVAQAQARLEGARAALAGAEATLQSSEANYQFLTGLQAGDLAPPPPVPPLPATLEDALAAATINNPSIAAAREDLRAAEAAVDSARADGRPQISLVGTASAQETFGDANQRDTSVSALAQARIPLLSGGVVKAQTESAKLRRAQARRFIDNLETQVRAQVTQAWYSYDASLRSIEASRRQVEASEIAYEGAMEELSVGVRSTLDTLDQEQQLFDARLALVAAERDAYVAAHNLLRATGALGTIG